MTAAAYGDEATTGGVRERLVRLAVVPSWAAVVALLAAFAAGVDRPPLAVQLLPLVASVVVLGLPHGALDHLAVARAAGRTPTRRDLAVVGACYLVLGGAYAVLWFLAPAVAAVGFVLLTWAHWGQGDVYPLVALFDGAHPATRVQRLLTAGVRGALPMALPLVAFPGQYERVLGWFLAPFGADTGSLSFLFTVETRVAVAGAVGVLAVSALANGYRHGGPSRAWVVDAAETATLFAYFLVVPPILAVGAYFALWHALRHVGRLLAVDAVGASALAGGDDWGALARFGREAVPMTAGALVVIVGLALAVPSTPERLSTLVGLYLVAIAVLTLPHVVVVTAMDREQGIL